MKVYNIPVFDVLKKSNPFHLVLFTVVLHMLVLYVFRRVNAVQPVFFKLQQDMLISMVLSKLTTVLGSSTTT